MSENGIPNAPEMVITDEGFDISALRDISVAESANEEKDTNDSEGEQESNPAIEASDGESDNEAASDASESEEDDSDDGASQSDTESKPDPEESKESPKKAKYLEAKHGEKTYKVPEDAEVTIPVDGKDVTMKISEAFRKASGVTFVEKETSRLGRERKRFDEERAKFYEESDLINSNLEAMMELSDPFEFCAYYGQLTGKDPNKVLEEMVTKAQQHYEQFANMTDNEKRLLAENRKYKLAQRHINARSKRTQEAEKLKQERQKVENTLKEENLTMEDFQDALQEMQQKLNDEGSLGEEYDNLETITPNEIIKYALNKQLHTRLTTAINSINKELSNDEAFVGRLKKALYSTERLHGKLSASEVSSFVKAALSAEKKHLSENLSKKVKTTTSKPVRSGKEEDEDGPVNLNEYLSNRGGFKILGF